MTKITLSQVEKKLIEAAASNDGCLSFQASITASSRKRLIGRFLRDGLIAKAIEKDGRHKLTTAAYNAAGLVSPKVQRRSKSKPTSGVDMGIPATAPGAAAPEGSSNKKSQVRALVGRPDGATLAELTAATGWQAHTVRAAVSRIRSSGQPVVKMPRSDAVLAYCFPIATATTSKPSRVKASGGRSAAGRVAQASAAATP